MSKRSGRYYRRYPWKRQNGRTRTWVHQSDSNAMCHWITGITLKWLWRPDFLYPKSEWETHASGSIDDNSILRIYTGTSHFIAKSLIFVSFAFFFDPYQEIWNRSPLSVRTESRRCLQITGWITRKPKRQPSNDREFLQSKTTGKGYFHQYTIFRLISEGKKQIKTKTTHCIIVYVYTDSPYQVYTFQS